MLIALGTAVALDDPPECAADGLSIPTALMTGIGLGLALMRYEPEYAAALLRSREADWVEDGGMSGAEKAARIVRAFPIAVVT